MLINNNSGGKTSLFAKVCKRSGVAASVGVERVQRGSHYLVLVLEDQSLLSRLLHPDERRRHSVINCTSLIHLTVTHLKLLMLKSLFKPQTQLFSDFMHY